jgi:hypothetical protein
MRDFDPAKCRLGVQSERPGATMAQQVFPQ